MEHGKPLPEGNSKWAIMILIAAKLLDSLSTCKS